MGGFRVSYRALTFVKTIVLARLLTPAQFGVFGIATLALALLEVLTETGINIFLIQDEGKIKDYLDTAWLVSILRGLIISIILLLAASPVAKFFSAPDSYTVLLLIALIPFVRGFINPAEIKFQKNLEFHKEFWFRFSIMLLDTVVAVTLSVLTHSVFALVWGMFAGVVLELIISWIIIKPRPKIAFDSAKVKHVINRGKWVTLAGIFNYLFQNGDNMTVGKLLGEAPLGIYAVAYKISSLPISEISDVFVKVTFPVYVKIASDLSRLKQAFIKTMLGSSALVILGGLVIYFFAHPIVSILLGPQWLAAVPVVRILSVFGIVKGILGPSLSLFLAVGKQEYATYTTLVGIIALAIPIIPLTQKYGLTGTGISVIISSVATAPLIAYYVWKIFKR